MPPDNPATPPPAAGATDDIDELEFTITFVSNTARAVLSRLRKAEADRDALAAECARLRSAMAALELRIAIGDAMRPDSLLVRMMDCRRGVEIGPNTPHPALAADLRYGTVADIARQILTVAGRPMSCMEMARAAVSSGVRWQDEDEARSLISATLAKDMKGPKPRFRQIARGEIGLIEWQIPEHPVAEVSHDRQS